MTSPADALSQIEHQAQAELQSADSAPTLEAWRIKYLGRRGMLPRLLRTIKDQPLTRRRDLGRRGNALRQRLESAYQVQRAQLPQVTDQTAGVPRPAQQKTSWPSLPLRGHYHPLTLTIRRVQRALLDIGFLLAEGPYAEEARYNFDLLNIPLEHPARAATDTFYLTRGLVLRTHTSPVQIRSVVELGLQPPLRVFSPGRVFRAEKVDPTHSHTFHQVEGLVVGEDVTVAHLKHTAQAFFATLFAREVATRLRPSYFPFVEPGFEVDISCIFCRGPARHNRGEEGSRDGNDQPDKIGCRICQHSGWLELMGAGMMHPNVLRNVNINPERYQGFAFGAGLDRLTMLLHGIDDIRRLWTGDVRFLQQFS